MFWSRAGDWEILCWVSWFSIIRDFLLQSEPSVLSLRNLGKVGTGDLELVQDPCLPPCPHFPDKGFVL